VVLGRRLGRRKRWFGQAGRVRRIGFKRRMVREASNQVSYRGSKHGSASSDQT
jgi:hypothetical protein